MKSTRLTVAAMAFLAASAAPCLAGNPPLPGVVAAAPETRTVTVVPPPPDPRRETIPAAPPSQEAQIWHPGQYDWVGGRYSWSSGYWMAERELPPPGPDAPAGRRLFRQGHWESSGPGSGTFFWVPPGWL